VFLRARSRSPDVERSSPRRQPFDLPRSWHLVEATALRGSQDGAQLRSHRIHGLSHGR